MEHAISPVAIHRIFDDGNIRLYVSDNAPPKFIAFRRAEGFLHAAFIKATKFFLCSVGAAAICASIAVAFAPAALLSAAATTCLFAGISGGLLGGTALIAHAGIKAAAEFFRPQKSTDYPLEEGRITFMARPVTQARPQLTREQIASAPDYLRPKKSVVTLAAVAGMAFGIHGAVTTSEFQKSVANYQSQRAPR